MCHLNTIRKALEDVASDISLHIKAGQTVGIIGQTGAAKSTLVQLIPRLYEATKGTVLVDGHPVWEYPLRELRDSIAVVLQKTRFSGTVKDNLRWGKETATDEELMPPAGSPVRMNLSDGWQRATKPSWARERQCVRRTETAPVHCQSYFKSPQSSDPGRFHQRCGYCH